MINPFFLNVYKGIYNNSLIGFYYTIQKDESLEIISKRYRVPVNNIIIMNKLTYPYIVKEGDKLFVPGVKEPTTSFRGSIYNVKFGDTIDSIAKKYNIDTKELMEKNYIKNKGTIFVGQKLLIPGEKEEEVKNQEDISLIEDEIKIYPFSSLSGGNGSPEHEAAVRLGQKFSQIKRGDRGKDVTMLQRLISTLGYKIRRMDGVFGDEMERRIKEFQRKVGIQENGIVDETVWQHIFNSINSINRIKGY